ncbi:MAG: hypothetical protein ACRDKL_11200, partial [Solirubrobacteraceae bacterium]
GPPSPPRAGIAAPAPAGNPFSYDPAQARALSERAALGNSQVLFTKSPGGAIATAARVAALRALIQRAVRGTDISAALLEGLVFVESAGRSQVIAGDSVEDAAGLTQILAGTAQTMLGMRVRLRASQRLTDRIAAAQAAGQEKLVRHLEAERARVDQRFNPELELAGTVRYLRTAQRALGGRADLATAAYHAGIGNIQQVLGAYDGGHAVPYAQLYFDSSLDAHTAALQALEQLTDDGARYYWRVLGAERIMSLWRTDRAALRRWALQAEAFPSDALVLLGLTPSSGGGVPATSGAVPVYSDPDALAHAYWAKPAQLRPLPRNAGALHLRYDPAMGELAPKLGAPRAIYRGLRPVALRMLIQIAAWADRLAGTAAPLTVAETVQDSRYSAREGFDDDPPAATGYTFQIQRRYASEAQRGAFQFVLDRLQDLNLIAWIRGATTIEITVAPDAERALAHGLGGLPGLRG